jgi:hypothetical protein
MKRILFTAAMLVAMAPLAIAQTAQGTPSQPAAAQGQTKSPVEGVWRIAEMVMPGGGAAEKGTTITNPQPSLIIFTRGHYSQVIVRGQQPRAAAAPAKDPRNPTDAEKLALLEEWRPVGANAGTYEVKGTTIIRRAIVAKSVEVMTSATPLTSEYKLEGTNTLWLIPTGDRAATDPRLKLTRLE